ncbi:MAG TPA: phytoene desaturase family protein [Pseudonocardiaceae bacterium]|nr:phytoene desaturase family protein [Pseudonocardiaceae bacterium]
MRTVPGPTDHVVIVGAGLAGLSAALHLLGAGRQVTLIESQPHPGGRAGRTDLAGYHLDTGPTVLTMPELIDEALAAVGDSITARLDLVALHPAYRARFADGSVIDVHTDAEAMEAEVRAVAGPAEADGYRRLRNWLTRLYQVEIGRFIGGNFDSPLDLVAGRDAIRELVTLAALGGFGRLGPQVGRFLSDKRLQRLFSFQALYAGVPPQRALGAYAVIAYMDTVAGVWFPRGGMRAVPQAMADAAADAGARLRYGSAVIALEHSGDRVTAVRTADGERIAADAVVLTPDLPVVHRLLGRAPRRAVPLRWSPSAVVLHAGIRPGTGPGWAGLAHHTILFGQAWESTFDEIIYHGRLMTDPSLLITRPTATDPTLAPAGRELLYVLAPCPNLHTAPLDWATLGPAYRDELVSTLENRGLADLGDTIEVEQLVTPADWAAQGLAVGTPFSAAHTFAQTGPFRPSNLARGRVNVVLAGCGTTPGVGVPTAIISGRLAAARITAAGARRGAAMSG